MKAIEGVNANPSGSMTITTSQGTVPLSWADTGLPVQAGQIPQGTMFSVDNAGRVWLGRGKSASGRPGMTRKQRRANAAERRRGK